MSLKPVLWHPTLGVSKNMKFRLSEFDKIRCGSYISRDDSNGEIHFVIQDLENFRVFTKMTILPFFRKLEFSWVLQPGGSPELGKGNSGWVPSNIYTKILFSIPKYKKVKNDIQESEEYQEELT